MSHAMTKGNRSHIVDAASNRLHGIVWVPYDIMPYNVYGAELFSIIWFIVVLYIAMLSF